MLESALHFLTITLAVLQLIFYFLPDRRRDVVDLIVTYYRLHEAERLIVVYLSQLEVTRGELTAARTQLLEKDLCFTLSGDACFIWKIRRGCSRSSYEIIRELASIGVGKISIYIPGETNFTTLSDELSTYGVFLRWMGYDSSEGYYTVSAELS